jgi:hypothetical protein
MKEKLSRDATAIRSDAIAVRAARYDGAMPTKIVVQRRLTWVLPSAPDDGERDRVIDVHHRRAA